MSLPSRLTVAPGGSDVKTTLSGGGFKTPAHPLRAIEASDRKKPSFRRMIDSSEKGVPKTW